jgi:ABC-type Fe3+ transport system substrate-binding protein
MATSAAVGIDGPQRAAGPQAPSGVTRPGGILSTKICANGTAPADLTVISLASARQQIRFLFVLLGDERARAFMQSLQKNDVKLSPSNGDSADQVARGQFAFSLVDSDDAVNRMNQHEPVTMVYPDQDADEIGCFIVTDAAVLIAGSPNQDKGKKLIDYLLSSCELLGRIAMRRGALDGTDQPN